MENVPPFPRKQNISKIKITNPLNGATKVVQSDDGQKEDNFNRRKY